MTLFDLTDDVILVTGAAGGIGRAAATALRGAGATVIATDRHGTGDIMPHDVTSPADWSRIVDHISAQHQKLSCVVNNAGLAVTRSIEETTLDSWRRVQSVNVESILLGMHACLDLLRATGATRAGGAAVVNLSSAAGLRGTPFHAAYAASKAAVYNLTQSAAAEWAALKYLVRVNSIHPGGIDTPMMAEITATAARYMGGDPAEVRAAMEARHPMGRFGRAEEIAGGIVYLCAPASSYVTGTALSIDGGWAAT